MSSDQKTTTTTTSADAAPAFQLNVKKLKELAESASAIKIGGKVRCVLLFRNGLSRNLSDLGNSSS